MPAQSSELERELTRVREDYRGALEELESSNDELRSAYEEMQSANADLYADPAHRLASIKPDAIRQGEVNDCYFLSTLSSMVARPYTRRHIDFSTPPTLHWLTRTRPNSRPSFVPWPVTVTLPPLEWATITLSVMCQ